MDVRERLLAKREIDPVTGCWNWMGGRNGGGYGIIRKSGVSLIVSRLAASVYKGFDITSNLFVLHRCDNPPCFNPEHLFIGTPLDNIRDMFEKGRAYQGDGKHCTKGHEFTEENTFRTKRGRQCRVCRRGYRKTYKARRRDREAQARL